MTDTHAPETWPHWLRRALDERGWSQADLGRTGIVKSDSTISKWLDGAGTPKDPGTVVKIARVLAQDPIAALYAARHNEVAELAEQMRADRIGALTKYELDGIEDGDPELAALDADAAHGAIPADEYRRLRNDHLRRKEESIRLMQRDYEEALRRNAQTPDKPESDNGGHRRAL